MHYDKFPDTLLSVMPNDVLIFYFKERKIIKWYICRCNEILSILHWHTHWLSMEGWMTRDLTSFLTVFQLYKDNERLIIKGCVQWNYVYSQKDFPSSGTRPGTARSVGQCLTYCATSQPAAPLTLEHWYLKVPSRITKFSLDTFPFTVQLFLSQTTNISR